MVRIILVCYLLIGAHMNAVADLTQIRERGVLRVGIKNDRAGSPDGHKDPAHVHKRDFEIELARAFADHLFGTPDKVEFSTRHKPQRLAAVATGEIDLSIAMHRIADGNGAVTYSAPYYETGLACLQRTDGGIAKLDDLAGKVVAVVGRNSDALPAWLAEATATLAPPPTIVAVANFRDAAAAIATGRVDAPVSEGINIETFLARHGDGLTASPPLTFEPIGVAVASRDHELVQFVNAVIAELERTGRLADMRERAGLSGP